MPTGLVLRYEDKAGLVAELLVWFDIYEMLQRLNEGYRPSVEEEQAVIPSLHCGAALSVRALRTGTLRSRRRSGLNRTDFRFDINKPLCLHAGCGHGQRLCQVLRFDHQGRERAAGAKYESL
jgi:hypothetical protein